MMIIWIVGKYKLLKVFFLDQLNQVLGRVCFLDSPNRNHSRGPINKARFQGLLMIGQLKACSLGL